MLKKVLSLFTIVLIGFTLVACNGEKEDETRELNLAISGLQQATERVFFTTFVRLFESEYNAKVNVSYTNQADLRTKIQSEQDANNVVTDVVMVDTANMSPYINNGWMEDISGVISNLDGRTITNMFDNSTSSGSSTYFLPISFDIYISIYNVAALPYIPETVSVTRNASNDIIKIDAITWEELGQWAINIKTETGEAKFGFPMATAGGQLLYPMGGQALAFGSASYPLLNDEGAVAAWNNIAEVAAAGAILPEGILSETNQPTTLLLDNHLWLSFGHMGPIGQAYAAQPANFVLGPAPVAEETGQAGSTAGAWAFGIVKGAANQDVAKDWLDFITQPEINYLYTSGLGGVISPVMEVVNELGTSNTDQIMAAGLAVLNSGAHVTGLPIADYTSWDAVKSVYLDLYRRLLTGVPLTQAEADAFQTDLDALKVN